MKFYHYSSLDKMRDVQSGWGYGQTGLIPMRRFIPLGTESNGLPEKATEGAIFGLLNPFDPAWCTQSYHAGYPLLESIVRDILSEKICLLEVNLKLSDDAYVADYGPHLRTDYDGLRNTDKNVLKDVKRDYWDSLVPFSEYPRLETPHQVPEVICFSAIPLERLRVIKVLDRHLLKNIIRRRGGFEPYRIVQSKLEKRKQYRLKRLPKSMQPY